MNIIKKIFGKKLKTYDFKEVIDNVEKHPSSNVSEKEKTYILAEIIGNAASSAAMADMQKQKNFDNRNYSNNYPSNYFGAHIEEWAKERELKLLEKARKDLESKITEKTDELTDGQSKETEIVIISEEQLANLAIPSILNFCVDIYEDRENENKA